MPSLMVDKSYPSPEKLIEIEIKTFQTITHDPTITKNFTELSRNANSEYKTLSSKVNNKCIPPINFSSGFSIQKDGQDYEIRFGVSINVKSKNEYERISYYLAICIDNPKKVIRYFHFDYALPASVRKQSHPIFHMQYGNKLLPILRNQGYEFIDDALELPRIPHFPMTLAFLLNTIFMEFYNETTHTIINRSEWCKLIKEHEEIMLGPYYKSCHELMEGVKNKSNTSFIKDCYYYGKSE